MLKKALTVGAVFVLACSAVHGEAPSIVDITPDSTMGVMHVPNAEQTIERLKETRLWELWQSDDMTELRAEMIADMDESMAALLEKFEMQEEDIVWPTGALGASAFTTRDEEMGVLTFGLLASMDYGDDAGKAQEWLDKAIELAEKDGEIEYESREVLGRTVHCIEIVRPEQLANQPGMGGGMGGGMGMADPESMIADATDEVFIVRESSVFLVSTDMNALHGALEVHDSGEPAATPSRERIREMLSGVGADSGEHDVYTAVVFRDIGQLISANDTMGMTMMLFPMVKQVLGDVQSMASASRIGGERAMIESTSKVYMPMGKAGLTALMTESSPRGDVPGFVGPDTVSYTFGNFRFNGLADALQPVFQMAQMMMQPQQGQPMLSDIVRQATSSLGDRFWMAQSVSRPLQVDSMRQVFAIACEKPKELENFVSEFGAQMGMQGRDFLGHRIYTAEMGGMMPPMGGPGMAPSEPMAIGFGGPMVFAGPSSSVEQALRSVGNAEAATLADEPAFQRGMAALSKKEGVAWGWTDLVTTAEVQSKITDMEMKQFMDELGNEDPEFLEELEAMGLEENPLSDVDWDLLRRYIGPTVWELEPVDDGFVHRSFVLDAE